MKHKHEDCKHELKFCSKCDIAYCVKCEREWGKTIYVETAPYIIPYTTPYVVTPSTNPVYPSFPTVTCGTALGDSSSSTSSVTNK